MHVRPPSWRPEHGSIHESEASIQCDRECKDATERLRVSIAHERERLPEVLACCSLRSVGSDWVSGTDSNRLSAARRRDPEASSRERICSRYDPLSVP